MRIVDLRGTDLNLLPVLAALLAARSVTGAARMAGLSQPAMSRALGRLRARLGDPLLVQGRLTPRAEALAAPLAAALAATQAVLDSAPFDPAQAQGELRMAATDNQTMLLLPRLVPVLSAAAPGLDLRVEPYSANTAVELRDGRLDLAFGVVGMSMTAAEAGLRSRKLYADSFVSLLRPGHPAAANWTPEGFAGLDHVLVSTGGEGLGAVDLALAGLGLKRRVALRIPHFFAAFGVVAATDMVVTLPLSLAAREAAPRGLVALPPPIAVPGFEVMMLWGEVLDAEPRHRWLRGVVAEVARTP